MNRGGQLRPSYLSTCRAHTYIHTSPRLLSPRLLSPFHSTQYRETFNNGAVEGMDPAERWICKKRSADIKKVCVYVRTIFAHPSYCRLFFPTYLPTYIDASNISPSHHHTSPGPKTLSLRSGSRSGRLPHHHAETIRDT